MTETDNKKDLVQVLLEGSETERAVAAGRVAYGHNPEKETRLRDELVGYGGD